jgi:hypothetical protein
MQPRLIIATAFFVIGALIAIPALTDVATPARPVRTMPVNAPAATLAPSSTSPSATAAPSASPSKPPKPTPSPSRSPKPTATPTPTPPKPPAIPISVRTGKVHCPSSKIQVTVTNKGQRTEDYAILVDDATVLADRVGPGGVRETSVPLEENRTSTLEVVWGGRAALAVKRKADCVDKKPEKPEKTDGAKALPHTGPDDGDLYAKIATGVAAMITGIIIFWYGSIWPRRRARELESNG